MVGITDPWRQVGAGNVISASTSSARAALARSATQNNVVVTNPTSGSVCFVNFGDSSNVAINTDAPVLPGTYRIFGVPAAATHVAVLLDTGSGTIYVSCGDGI